MQVSLMSARSSEAWEAEAQKYNMQEAAKLCNRTTNTW